GQGGLVFLLDSAATLWSREKNAPGRGVSQLLSVLDLLAQTVRSRNVKPERADRALRFLDSPDAAIRHAAARLCGALKLEPARQTLVAWLGDPKLDAAAHQAALDGLLSLGGQATLKILTSLIEKADAPPVQRGQAIQALAALDLKAAAKRAAEFLTSLGDTAAGPAAATPVFDAFVTKKEGPAALVAALSDKKLSEPIARIGLQKAGSAGGDTKALQAALATAANMKPMDQALTPEQMSALVEEVKKNGDAAHGQEIYRRKELLCQTCHAIAGGGSEVGPDMVSLGAAAQIDYLIESLLNPSAKIKEGYHTTVVSTKDGSVFAGTVVKKDDQAITLRDAASQTKVIPIGNVAKQEIQPISLMPPGLTANLRRDEFCHLVKFMSELGREGAFKVPTQSYVRRWRILHPTEEMGRAHNLGGDRIFASEDLDLDWQPDYSTVDGSLPAVSVPLLDFWNKFKRGVAQFEIEMLKPGTVTLGFLEPAGLKVVAGERVLDANERTTLELPAARQKVAVFFEASRHAPLRVELIAEPSATGQARLVTGR
ncbi:MAG: HEAT repeat domain-containing protein, partial [Verrucomicrobiales bacterium]